MFIISKRNFKIRRADGEVFRIQKDFVGTIPADVADHPLIRSALDEYANGTEVDYDPVLAGRYAAEMLRRIADGQKKTGEKLPGEDPVIP